LGDWSGSAYVFERDQSASWAQVAKLLASDGAPLESFGASVAVSANVVVVGAPNAWLGDWYVGAAYVFERAADGAWTETAKVMAEDADLGQSFGSSVGLSGEVVVVGHPATTSRGKGQGQPTRSFDARMARGRRWLSSWARTARKVTGSVGASPLVAT
ncbi:MAG TPA: hypothetical protein VM243_03065, partial [Phycisphaerae bacterium]|nr:hypothetical protein [Phycisphaerae bacterium]